MIRRPPRSTLDRSSAASDVYKRQLYVSPEWEEAPIMRLKFLVTLAGVCLLTALATAQNSKQIQIFASILDGSGAPAQTVEAGDIRLMENGADAKVTKVE